MAYAFRSTRVLTPRGIAPATVLVEQEHIIGLCGWDEVPVFARLQDFGDHVLLPGLVDTHVHINEPGRTDWEGFTTATRAAAAGGVTTIVDMPLNCMPETVNLPALEDKRKAACGKAWVDWAAWGGLVRDNAEALVDLASAGVPGFKCFLIDSGIEGFPWVEEAHLIAALTRLSGSGLPVLAHAEVPRAVVAARAALNSAGADWRKYTTYLAARPDEAEIEAIALLIRLAREFKSPIHIVHLSSARALPLIGEARREGLPITVETCPHYLWFAAEDIPDGATEFKCAPPIRNAANREALWGALADGLIDLVASDHSPCPPALKSRGSGDWDQAWGGISSLGLTLPIMWTSLMRRGLEYTAGLERLGHWLAAAPARLAGLHARKGSFIPGADADLVVFNPDPAWTITADRLHFRHKFSPYLGVQVNGRVLETWLRGVRVYKHCEPLAEEDCFSGLPQGRELVRS